MQGADHWESVSAKWNLTLLEKIAGLPLEKRAGWRAGLRGAFSAQSLVEKAKYQDALPLQMEFSKWCREVLGEEHPDTATGYNNVAMNLNSQGKSAEAEPASPQGPGDPPQGARRGASRHGQQL